MNTPTTQLRRTSTLCREHTLALLGLTCLITIAFTGTFANAFHLDAVVEFLSPWEFSPTVLVSSVLAAGLYANGLRHEMRTDRMNRFWRPLAFFVGLGSVYLMLQTRIDYFAEHMFFVHRAQHIFLHHIGPFLLALSAPRAVLLKGMPRIVRERFALPLARGRITRGIFKVLQNPIISASVFVGLIYVWLMPPIFFDAMLSIDLYKLMNWSMVLDGVLFWWLMLNPNGRLSHLSRMLVLWMITIPQIVLGAYLALTSADVYPVYKLCGRAFAMNALLDQHIGGLIIWIPGSMMSIVAILIVFRQMLRSEAREHAGNSLPSRAEV